MKKLIPIAGPSITEKEVDYVADAAAHGWFENANLYNQRFEAAFAEYVGTRFAISLPSCTSAIHLSLAALGIGPGDEVIVPDITWIATAAPISYVGATPIFADVDEATWCMTGESFGHCIGERTKAVIPVDLYGNMAEMDAIHDRAHRHGIAVIEDAAEAVGSEFKGRRAGSLGDAGVFSFHGSKTMTTGEGGMVVTGDDALHARMLVLRDHGREPGNTGFFNSEVAFKYKMSALQAALGLAQLERIDELVEGKCRIFSCYQDRLKDMPCLRLNFEVPGTKSSYWMVTVVWDHGLGLAKEDVMECLLAEGINTRPFFHPLSSLPAYRDAIDTPRAQRDNGVSYRLGPCGINLPSGLNLTEQEVDYICDRLHQIFTAAPGVGNETDQGVQKVAG